VIFNVKFSGFPQEIQWQADFSRELQIFSREIQEQAGFRETLPDSSLGVGMTFERHLIIYRVALTIKLQRIYNDFTITSKILNSICRMCLVLFSLHLQCTGTSDFFAGNSRAVSFSRGKFKSMSCLVCIYNVQCLQNCVR